MTDKPTVIILLGSTNDGRGVLSSIARERCDRAVVEFRRCPGSRILPTGAWGDHFNTTQTPHGQYLRDYLVAQGIPADAILEHVESSNTVEDAKFSRPVLEHHGFHQLIVITSDFHLARAQYLFAREFPDLAIQYSASPTVLPSEEWERKLAHERSALAKLKEHPRT
jgi:uncharacterized SAM-binding protein YcdF (DUF218 family)